MNVIVAHNAYRLHGGEDSVVRSEVALLESQGHRVHLLTRTNDEIDQRGALSVAAEALWSRRTTSELRALCRDFRPDVIHAHNTFPLISPSLYWAAAEAQVPVVQTLHNFRLFCAQAMFLRNGRVCEDCIGRLPWRGVVRKCYRSSTAQSAVLVGTIGLHRGMGTWKKKVTRYIALNEFCRDKFIEGGLPAERIVVKPNFVEPPPERAASVRRGLLFVGRLSPEKGVDVLVEATRSLHDAELTVAGTGPLSSLLDTLPRARILGAVDADAVSGLMSTAVALVVPSLWYENFPRTIVEAFSNGLPVIASRIGALAELIEDGVTGLLVPPGDAAALAEAMTWASSHPDEMAGMGRAALQRYRALYTPERNHEQLLDIYAAAIAAHGAEARKLETT